LDKAGRGSILIATVILARGIRLSGVRLTRRELRLRRAAFISAAASVHVRVRRVVARGAVRVLVAAARRWVVIHGRSAARRRTIVSSPPVIVVLTPWGRGALTVPVPITIPARAISTRRAAPVIVVRGGRVSTTGGARAGSVSSGSFRLRVCNAGHTGVLKVAAIQLLDGCSEIGSSLKLDKTFAAAVAVGLRVDDIKARLPGEVFQILPAGIIGESRDLHTMRCAAGSGSIVALTVVVAAAATAAAGALVAVTGAAGELDSETLAHEVRSMESWDDIPGIHGILVLDEAKTVHKLDLGNLTGAMGREVSLNIGLGSIPGQIAQVEAGGRHFSHCCRNRFLVLDQADGRAIDWMEQSMEGRRGDGGLGSSVLRVG
jgi:hypothetical protein